MTNLEKQNQGITQSNLISRGIYSCKPMARKIIAYAMKQAIQNKNLKNNTIFFTISEFLDALSLVKCNSNYTSVKTAVKECKKLDIIFQDTETAYEAYSWFTHVYYNQDKNIVVLQFSDIIFQTIKEWKQTGYSYIDLNVIGKLRNIYSIRWYEIALAYYNMKDKNGYWKFSMTMEEIKRTFMFSDISHIVARVIQKPIESLNEINPLFFMTYEKEYSGKEHKIVSIILHCQERKAKLIADENRKLRNKIKAGIDNLALKEVKQNALEVTEEKKRIENIKSMHMLEYAQLLQEEYQKTNDSFPPNIRSSFAESNAISILLEKYKDE